MRTNTTVRRITEAIVALLREPLSVELHRRLAIFQAKEWESSFHWLDANGLALYFRRIVRSYKLQSYVPQEVLTRLDQNYVDNQSRLAHQLIEFRTVNQHLHEAGVRYANLKGFTLEPDYCPDLSLRYQCDTDLMVRRSERRPCRVALEELGYRLTSEQADTLEFKPPEEQLPDIADLYKPRKQQAVEVHFATPKHKLDLQEVCLDRLIWVSRSGVSVPCLAEQDMFYSVIFHLYRHLLSEWVRLSWFYELEFFLQNRAPDLSFWREVLGRAEADQQTAQALALVMAFSKQAFSGVIPDSLVEFCQGKLNKSAQLWILHYGRELLFSDFPGNKLYLLLLRELKPNPNGRHDIHRERLLPFHAPARALHGNSWVERIRYIPGNTSYGLSRAQFHAREGFRYLKEQWRWKRQIAHATVLEPESE